MSLRLYNTLTRSLEAFKPITPGKAGVYACGPTVYWFAHIGNFRYFIFSDLLHRVLKESGLDTTFIMNITDVGHLVGDGDDGEDKMMKAMRKEGKSAAEIAFFYTRAFVKDLLRLNILPADKYPRATEHIPEQVAMVKQLEANGFTYKTSDGIYFDTSKLPAYGKLSGQKSDEKQAGIRIDMGEKKNPTDFALWKFSPTDQQREMEWPSPWGVGFPGWHLECSAMAQKYLGVPFDIHTGGVDHIAVHHENEIAQTEGASGKLEANVWLHSEFLTVDGGKMSKSIGNVYTIQDLIDKGYDPIAYRYFCLQGHYRSILNFTWEGLTAAQNALNKLRQIVRDWSEPDPLATAVMHTTFMLDINNDLNTPGALRTMWQLVDDDSISSLEKTKWLVDYDRILGLGLADYIGKKIEIPKAVQDLVNERDQARARKDFVMSDELRMKLEGMGWVVKDTKEGTKVEK
ncbi:cysteine--tRNA ligase [Candidatus Uhrbacteria bacterium]|nr:cysteine--tRNA ligase [Candidatus Uhrbacteria bacterium]